MSEAPRVDAVDACGCCETPELTYPAHYNRPGLDALRYRLATHSGFFARMVAQLTRDQLPDDETTRRLQPLLVLPGRDPADPTNALLKLRPLAALTSRDLTDPTIALLDAWATVADVLTFYQERVANEGFLRTATERRSVLELARSIGYELKPGVAASTVLAFTVDAAKGSPPEVKVPARTRVLSIPVKDELPQTFETVEEIVARAQWNALEPHTPTLVTTDPIARHVTELRLKGTGTGLRPGDAILIVGDERADNPGDEHWDFRVLEHVESVPDKGYTRIAFSPGLGDQHPTEVGPAQSNPRIYALRLRAALFGHNAPEWDRLDPSVKLREAPRALEVITGAAFAPRGGQAVCSTVDGTLRSWNLTSGQALAAFAGHAGSANCVAYSPDGRYVVSGGDDGTVRVWDAATGQELRAFAGHRGPVLSVACASYEEEYEVPKLEGQTTTWDKETRTRTLAVSGGADSDIRVWDMDELPPGQPPLVRTLSHHKGAVNGLGLRLAGKIPLGGTPAAVTQRLVSGGDDGDVLMWSGCILPNAPAAGPQSLGTHAGAVEAVAISVDGARVASGGADAQVKTWALPAGGAWSSHRTYSSGAAESITALAFSTAGDIVLAGKADGALQLCNWASGGVTGRNDAHAGPVLAVAWSRTAAQILSGGADHKLVLRNTALNVIDTLTSKKPEDVGEWPGFGLTVNRAKPEIDLDTLYPAIVPGGWIVLARTGYAEVYRVTGTDVRWATGFSLSSKVTRLAIDSAEHIAWFGRRNTTVHAQSEPLELYVETQPDRSPLHGRTIELSGLVQGLETGRRTVVTGKRMRARIDDAEALSLTSADGYSSVDLADGDLLVCLSPPVPDRLEEVVTHWRAVGDGFLPVVRIASETAAAVPTLRWHLRDRNGFEGYVSVPLAPQADGTCLGTRITALRPAPKDESTASEAAVVAFAEDLRSRTRLHFTEELENLFDYETLRINANVARATHGETVAHEVLGSGDGTLSNQRFTLRKQPLTHVSAPTASGGESTLEVYVNGVRWKEVASLHDLDARSQSYLLRRDNEHKTGVVFGDGVHGARLPTGQENVVAVYRAGLGPDGEVAAEAVKLLQTKPLGIREAVNPVAATGAAAPESLAQARAHAPLTVLTLERIVSLKDYEDFAAGFAGVGKAQASALWTGSSQLVHITVATAGGAPLATGSALHENLLAAFARLRDRSVPVRVQGFVLLHFELTAQVRVDPRYRREQVEQQVRQALREAFSFERREFAQAVTHAEVTTVIQDVSGVVAVNLTRFTRVSEVAAAAEQLLRADRASWDADAAAPRPAQLLLLHPGAASVQLEEMPA